MDDPARMAGSDVSQGVPVSNELITRGITSLGRCITSSVTSPMHVGLELAGPTAATDATCLP